MTPRPLLAAGALAAALLLAGCAGSPPPSWHSVLPADAQPAAGGATPAPAAARVATLQVGRISVPDAVDRSSLVVATGTGLTVQEGQRWIEPVKAQLPRALALLLSDRMPGTAVTAWPAGVGGTPQWRLVADVQRFDLSAAPAQARLRVVWTLRPGDPNAGVAGPAATPQVFDVTVPATGGDDPAALVAAMRAALARWADVVARASGS
ncbi:PqiC family protein [Aquincola tertiaricarbonis]|uniref:PqiC family protein n=1 Tax=Aquincola tertiaricarbonis TaxID=391953 RepID=A0ABY4S6Z8_AQUTE|nr:PqiC family protein [Aquincola tertiaricarbonis]URI09173.1 PqiC family protein [Aquincola tertiaricarbonis]